MKRYTFLTLTLLLGCFRATVQSQAPSFAAPSSTGAQGSHSVSQYSGGLSVGIPLASIAGEYASVPVSLSYTAGNGVKVNQLSSAVGLGWNLNAGGMISRQVNGLPDDCKDIVDAAGNVINDGVGYLYRLGANNPIDYLVAKDLGNLTPSDRNHVFVANVDKEPDLFSFNFNGYSGTFVFDKDGVIRTHTKQDLIITYQLSPTLSPSSEYPEVFSTQSMFKGAIVFFTVTTPDGFKYIFAQKEAIVSKESSQSSDNFNEASLECSPKIKEPYSLDLNNANALFTAWHLTSIQSPIGGFVDVSFSYKNELYMDHSHIRQTCVNSTVLQQETDSEGNPGINSCMNNVKNTFSASANLFIKPRLEAIGTTLNGKLVFDYDDINRSDIIPIITLSTIISNRGDKYCGAKKLDNIRLLDKENHLLKTIHFDYIWNSLSCNFYMHDRRYKLLEIKEIYNANEVSLFKFGYDETPLPMRHSAQIDNWGYYNPSSAP